MEYKLVPSTSEQMIFNNFQFPTPNMMKEFSLLQDKTDYAAPLSVNPQNEKRWIRRPITAQPKPQRSISEPDLSSSFNPSADVVESPETTSLSEIKSERKRLDTDIEKLKVCITTIFYI